MINARAPRWDFQLLDSDNRVLESLDGVSGGGCEVAALSRLGWSGNVNLIDRGQNIDWMAHRFRAIYYPGIPGVEAWPVCTLMFTSPTLQSKSGTKTWDVSLLSLLAIVDEDTVESTYSLPADTPIISEVVALIESAGAAQVTVTESDITTRSPLMWDAGTPKLTIINDLLESAGYWSLWVDGHGMYRVEPYEAPGDRDTSFVFAAGEASIHSPDWSREQDLSSVPNRFIVTGQGDDETPALVGVAVNEDPESPYSFQARGRWVTAVEEGVDLADQAAADTLAQRRLLDRMSPVAKLTASHAVIDLDPNSVIEFAPLGLDPRRATVQRMSWDFSYDTLIGAEWREV